MKAGPVVSAPLVDLACQQPERLIHERLAQSAHNDAETISQLLVKAYNQGLRDGFQQGVQAATDAADERRKEAT